MSSLTNTAGDVEGVISQVGSIAGIGQASNDPKNDLVLTVGGQAISGWTEISITRGVERLPSQFDIALTQFYPGTSQKVTVAPGAPCTLAIGGDTVLTGYVDRYLPSMDVESHSIRITGRSKCADLVDCAAEWPGGQIVGADAPTVAGKLAMPYGIIIKLLATNTLVAIPQFNLMLGETAAEIIDRLCAFSGLLYYDDTDGNLIFAQAGTDKAASGFTQGVNVQRADLDHSLDQRYSEYDCFLVATNYFNDSQVGGPRNLYAKKTDAEMTALTRADGTPRNRKKFLIADPGSQGQMITEQRAAWELSRRAGRSWQVNLVTDSWRDSGGKLWTPNTLVPVNLPAIGISNVTYLVGEVTYKRTLDGGTTAELQLMPPEAYQLEPILLQPQPLVEAQQLTPPGGPVNPAHPSTPLPAISGAVAPAGTTQAGTTAAYQGITSLFDPGAPGGSGAGQ